MRRIIFAALLTSATITAAGAQTTPPDATQNAAPAAAAPNSFTTTTTTTVGAVPAVNQFPQGPQPQAPAPTATPAAGQNMDFNNPFQPMTQQAPPPKKPTTDADINSSIAASYKAPAPQAFQGLEPPPSLESLQKIEAPEKTDKNEVAYQIRRDAMREAALSYGARGGLAQRTYEIRQHLYRYENPLTRTFDFRALLIPAPSGLVIEPPIVNEAENALLIKNEGQTAGVSDRVIKIGARARIVSAPRTWRNYLERDWGTVEPPARVLLPSSDEERKAWGAWVAEGWKEGYAQGDDIFQADLDKLVRDFNGMVRYRQLLAQAMISQPFAVLEDRGVTGGGVEMRIGDRAVQITGPAQLQPRSELWTPAER
jgi:defect-in-organelle-trafficking protein DotC